MPSIVTCNNLTQGLVLSGNSLRVEQGAAVQGMGGIQFYAHPNQGGEFIISYNAIKSISSLNGSQLWLNSKEVPHSNSRDITYNGKYTVELSPDAAKLFKAPHAAKMVHGSMVAEGQVHCSEIGILFLVGTEPIAIDRKHIVNIISEGDVILYPPRKPGWQGATEHCDGIIIELYPNKNPDHFSPNVQYLAKT